MRAGRLVGSGPIKVAFLIVAPGAKRVLDIVQDIILGDPTIRLFETTRKKVDAVGSAQG
jgi:hypothetical protein